MKNLKRAVHGLFAVGFVSMAAAIVSCNKIPVESMQGTLSWNFEQQLATRSVLELPDTDDFILEVLDADGNKLYKGSYGASPESMLVDPGNYTVKVVSKEFTKPEFSAPQFGDEQVVAVSAGASTNVRLKCSQLNSGLKLSLSDAFVSEYSGGEIELSSSDGSLTYSFSEKRIAYFNPGPVAAVLEYNSTSVPLLTRTLDPCRILTIGITCPSGDEGSGAGTSMSIVVDTTRTWDSEDYVVGSSDAAAGSTQASAYGVGQAKEHVGEKEVWVTGFIVGGDLSSSGTGISFTSPFSSNTHMAIAARSSVTDKSSCMSVQLQKGEFRDLLNLVDHPDMLGAKVYLKGNIVSAYYGIPGIQSITDCVVKK